MEGHMNKRRRINSVESRKTMQASFARKYLNYLLPSLTKINSTAKENDQKEKIVRHEVDMALACSAEGFAWSKALKDKLQLNIVNNNINNTNVGTFKTSLTTASFKISSSSTNQTNVTENKGAGDNQINAMLLKKVSSTKRQEMEAGTVKEEGIESEEEALRCVRNVLPGGKEMMVDDETLLCELGSYISCLELQVNILRSMVETN